MGVTLIAIKRLTSDCLMRTKGIKKSRMKILLSQHQLKED